MSEVLPSKLEKIAKLEEIILSCRKYTENNEPGNTKIQSKKKEDKVDDESAIKSEIDLNCKYMDKNNRVSILSTEWTKNKSLKRRKNSSAEFIGGSVNKNKIRRESARCLNEYYSVVKQANISRNIKEEMSINEEKCNIGKTFVQPSNKTDDLVETE